MEINSLPKQAGDKPLVIVTMKSVASKLSILRTTGKLKGSGIYINPDRTTVEQNNDKKLRLHANGLRPKGHKVILKNLNIMIDDKWYNIDPNTLKLTEQTRKKRTQHVVSQNIAMITEDIPQASNVTNHTNSFSSNQKNG